ncbi:MAG TPA: GNAT family N-acetyltransferase [Candidatus Obscuribacterales bacterium]
MQIRLGTRPDEPKITELVLDVMKEFGLTPSMDGAEADLKNIEANYFARDGVFLVAEEEGEIVGIASARKEYEGILELVRFAVAKKHRGKGIARELLNTVLKFARDMEYERVQVEPARQYPGGASALMKMGFTSDNVEDAQPVWYYKLRS